MANMAADDHLHQARDLSLELARVCDQLAEAHENLGQRHDAELLREIAAHDREVANRHRVNIEQRDWMRSRQRIEGVR